MLFYINILLISFLAILASRPMKLFLVEKIICSFLIFWITLIFTGYSLSIFSLLNHHFAFFFVSTAYAGIFVPVLKLLNKGLDTGKGVAFSLNKSDEKILKKDAFLISILLGLTFFIVAGVLILCFYYFPNNPDAEAYRFPRVYFYKSQGNLLHYATGVDPRIIFYPLNGVLSHMIVAVYGVDSRWLHLFPFLTWIFSGVVTYAVSRRLKSSMIAGVLAGFLTISTQIMLSVSVSGNDELMAAVPMAIALLFGLIWIEQGRHSFAFLSLLGILISIATKEHFLFYWLFFLVLGFWLLISDKLKFIFRFLLDRWKLFSLSILACLSIFLIHILINFKSSGKTSTDLAAAIINSKVNLFLPVQNFAIYLLQMFLTPLPDLWPKAKLGFLIGLYSKFQFLFNYLVGWVKIGPDYGSPFDPFRGILMLPESAYRMESTVWFGFVPHAFLILLIVFYKNFLWRRSIAPWLIASFFLWILGFSFVLKFQYTIQSYMSYALLFAMPAFALGFDVNRSEENRHRRNLIGALFVILVITNVIFSYNILRDCVRRNVKAVIDNNFAQLISDSMDERAVAAIKASSKIQLYASHWEVPYLNIIRRNPSANFKISNVLDEKNGFLNVALYQSFSNYGNFAIDIPWKKSDGLGYLGKMNSTYGPEFIFCYQVDSNLCSGKIVKFHSLLNVKDNSVELEIGGVPLGEKKEDELLYRFSIVSEATGSSRHTSEWISLAKGELYKFKDTNLDLERNVLRIEVKDSRNLNYRIVKDFKLKPAFDYSI